MLVKNNSICIVASTLPVGFIASQVDSLRIKRIIVVSKALERSYQSLKDRHPSIEVVQAPSGFLVQPLYFFWQLLAAKLGKNSIIVFHECCMPLLDLLLKLVRPAGYYLPQVSMSGFQEISFDQFPKSKLTCFLRVCGFVPCFKYYRSPSIGGNKPEYALSIKEYPGSIIAKDIQFSRERISRHYSGSQSKTRKILFITGKSYASNIEQLNVYRALIECANSRGYACHIKDHPNPTYRLDLPADNAVAIDPLVPVELLERDYDWAVGVSSSSLLAFDGRSISLANLFESMSAANRASIANHFYNANPENKIRYINSIDEFTNLL